MKDNESQLKKSRKKPYNREVVCSGRGYEVVLITWPPGACSAAHDHGTSLGVIKILEGKVYQKVFDKKTKKFLFKRAYGKGKSFEETPDIIHLMGNASKDEGAITLHVYTPRLKMKTYDLA